RSAKAGLTWSRGCICSSMIPPGCHRVSAQQANLPARCPSRFLSWFPRCCFWNRSCVNGVNNEAAEAESSADACSAIALSESLPLLQRDPVGRTCPMLFEFFDFFGEDVGSRFVLALYVPRFENAEIKKNQKLK